MRLFDLTGRVAIVTGGNGGIGLGMARGLCEAGAHAVLVGRNREKGDQAASGLDADGLKASFIEADVTDEAACRRAVASVVAAQGGVDILINNAGIAIRKQPEDYTLAEWHKVLDTNLTSAFIMSQAVHTSMKARGGGKIISIGSVLALFGAPFSVAYSSSKGGLVQFTKALATAWAPDNIQVNAILPGWIDTELTVAARAQVEGLEAKIMDRVPAKRWGKVQDFAGAAIFLSGAASDFVTGTSLLVDGGFAAQG
ncbi:SDR family NAD(P)-dependent oxidoreductase [Manganibacter manganicus]|uniref:2-deoxy-D-gluconate 3-dehydrogenase n=1 Tax=Manganibacter manganicus TaxID=1873176 RepID=A0A1V8RS55_9HYPH|nr:glucose 1-dehydrogenase [Pseudaminobacter manganicus]OQM76052.1 2-deoxy-D-gluconate 3-dehydrogenase [Pseudaminobacter manganicus]